MAWDSAQKTVAILNNLALKAHVEEISDIFKLNLKLD